MTEHAPLILDVAGTTLSAVDRRRLATLTGGVILFARNWENCAQLLALTSAIKAVRDDLLICVDHEGGRVQRFRSDGFTHLPPMRTLGDLWMRDGKGGPGSGARPPPMPPRRRAMCWAASCVPAGGFQLHAHSGPGLGGSTVIGDRAFHSDPRVVTLLAKAWPTVCCRRAWRIAASIFPAMVLCMPIHTRNPVDRRSLKAILQDDAAPPGWLRSTLTSVMPAHVIYPRWTAARPFFAQMAAGHPAGKIGF